MLETGDSGEDVGRIWNAILDAAKLGVEERVILCIIMQESTGNVGVGTPNDQDNNPTGGLMQAEGSPAFPGQHNLTQVCPLVCGLERNRLLIFVCRNKLHPWS